MKKCSHPSTGELLHGYELQILTPVETEAFELHLLECENCRNEIAVFLNEADFIRSSPESRMVVEEALGTGRTKGQSENWLMNQLWPKNIVLIFRPALLLLVITAIVGSSLLTRPDVSIETPGIYPIDHLTSLAGTRSAGAGKALKSSERNVLTLVFKDTWSDSLYTLRVISSDASRRVYENKDTKFNEAEATILLLEPRSLPSGEYLIQLEGPDGSSHWANQQFRYE